MWWDHVAHALRFVDFSSRIFNNEIMAIFEVTYGGYTRTDLLNMPFDEYHDLVLEVLEIQKKRQSQQDQLI